MLFLFSFLTTLCLLLLAFQKIEMEQYFFTLQTLQFGLQPNKSKWKRFQNIIECWTQPF